MVPCPEFHDHHGQSHPSVQPARVIQVVKNHAHAGFDRAIGSGAVAAHVAQRRHCKERGDEAIQPASRKHFWIAHMGKECVKAVGQLFVRLQASSSSRP